MTAPSYKPVFGPNGAVMNAPSVTPEMREKLERSARPPTAAELRRNFIAFAPYALIGVLAGLFSRSAGDIFDLVKSSPWWGGVFTGVVVTISVLLVARSAWRAIRRWEVLGTPRADRQLIMPEWGRWTLAASDVLAIVAYGLLVLGLLLSPAVSIESAYAISFSTAGLFGSLSLLLRYAADKLGWVWKQTA